jgi:hypothetical protein
MVIQKWFTDGDIIIETNRFPATYMRLALESFETVKESPNQARI